MSSIHHTLATGTRIDCYEVGRVLGVGGFGVTYQGYDHTLSRDVAIKEYLPSGVALRTGDGITVVPKSDQDQEFYSYGLDRFLEEARILAKFREHSIVRVTRFLEGNGTAYLIMDYEDGQPLNAYLKAQKSLSEDRLLSILVPLLHGLGEVHGKGYLHRDIKPGNIYLRRDGSPVLLDFGAARQSLGGPTRAVTSMVTPGYAPIEQYNTTGKQGPWTDFYGLGATLYRCVTGVSPAGAPDRIMALQAGDADPLVPASTLADGQYSNELLKVIDWMLRCNVADRPADVSAILAVLPGGSGAAMPGIGSSMSTTPDINTDSVLRSSTQWRREELENITQELAAHIGPMAKVLVKEASAKTSDLGMLYEMLAGSIPSSDGQQQFLKAGLKHAREVDSLRLNTAPPSQPTSQPVRTPSARSITGAPPLTDEIVARAEEQLASYIGPLAKMIVRRAVSASADARQFVQMLAQEIDNEKDRKKFLASMKV